METAQDPSALLVAIHFCSLPFNRFGALFFYLHSCRPCIFLTLLDSPIPR
jgi:hypothetical protein